MVTTSLFHWTLDAWFRIIGTILGLSGVFFVMWIAVVFWEHSNQNEVRAHMRSRLAATTERQPNWFERTAERLLSLVWSTAPGARLKTLVEEAQTSSPALVLALLIVAFTIPTLIGAIRGTLIGGPIVGLVLDAALIYWLRNSAKHVKQQFAEQLPEVFQTLATAMRTGQNITEAITYSSRHLANPAGNELRTVSDQLRKNLVLAQALALLRQRQPSADLDIAVNAILIQSETGGKLAEVLNSLANTIRVRRRAEADVRIATQQVRSTVYIVAGLVPALALIMSVESPGYLAPLFTPGLGAFLLFVVVVCELVGVGWTLYLVRVKY